MILKDFPSNANYFKSITTKNMEANYTLDDLVTKYKERYYNDDGFEKSFLNLLQNSSNLEIMIIQIPKKFWKDI